MKPTGHAACTEKTTNAYKVLIVKFHTKILFGRHGHGTETVCVCVQWIKLAPVRTRSLLYTNVLYSFLTSVETRRLEWAW